MFWDRFLATDGGLMSYGPNGIDQYRRAAGYVDRILKGEKPANPAIRFRRDARPGGGLVDQLRGIDVARQHFLLFHHVDPEREPLLGHFGIDGWQYQARDSRRRKL